MGSRDTQSFLSNPSAIQVEVRCDAHPIVCAPLDYTSQELLLIGNKAQLPVLLVGGASIHFSRGGVSSSGTFFEYGEQKLQLGKLM